MPRPRNFSPIAFRVISYDRRGRGESGDTSPYAVEREIEDLEAIIAGPGGGRPATVFAWSSGGFLALNAVQAGAPVARLALFEPPAVVDDSRPPLPDDYVERLEAAIATGRPGDAAELFLTAAVLMPDEFVAAMRGSEMWPGMEAIAPTISYDGRNVGDAMSGRPLSAERWNRVDIPVPRPVRRGHLAVPGLRCDRGCRHPADRDLEGDPRREPLHDARMSSRPRCARSSRRRDMGRIVVTEFISLDGVVEAPGGDDFKYPNWSFAFDRGLDGEQFKEDEAFASAALLLGRATYEGFAEAWPQYDGALADKYNGMPKYVVSSTLADPAWNNTRVLAGDLVDEVTRLKAEVDGEISVPGSIRLVQALLAADLVDELHLMTFPLILGYGRRLWDATPDKTRWELAEATIYGEGVLVSVYRRAR